MFYNLRVCNIFQCWGGLDRESWDVRVQFLQKNPRQRHLHFHSAVFQQYVFVFLLLLKRFGSNPRGSLSLQALRILSPGRDHALWPLISLFLSFSCSRCVFQQSSPSRPAYFLLSALISLADISVEYKKKSESSHTWLDYHMYWLQRSQIAAVNRQHITMTSSFFQKQIEIISLYTKLKLSFSESSGEQGLRFWVRHPGKQSSGTHHRWSHAQTSRSASPTAGSVCCVGRGPGWTLCFRCSV